MMIGLGTVLGSLLGPRVVARIGEWRSLWGGILIQGAFYLLAAAMPLIALPLNTFLQAPQHTKRGTLSPFQALRRYNASNNATTQQKPTPHNM